MMRFRTVRLGFAAALLTCSVFGQPAFNSVAPRSLGHPDNIPVTSAPNLVEGRELAGPAGVTVDTNGRVYVVDTLNSRVLGWRSLQEATANAPATVLLGQQDYRRTGGLGPDNGFSSGLRFPAAAITDQQGNLYVTDAGNNRVLRFPRPFEQPAPAAGDLPRADLVIGQGNLTQRAANRGGAPGPNTLATTVRQNNQDLPLTGGLAFDSAGNLWVSDSGNNRVLRYPARALVAGNNGPEADLVLGQQSFTTSAGGTQNINDPNYKLGLLFPSGLAFDQAGRLFVVDAGLRGLVYVPQANGAFANGQTAARVFGVQVLTQGQQAAVNDQTIGDRRPGRQARAAEGVFTIGNHLFVVDTGNHRILRYEPFDTWAPETSTSLSPRATAFFGQPSFTENSPNRGLRRPEADRFGAPQAGFVAGSSILIADTGNNRVVVIPFAGVDPTATANAVIGQRGLNQGAVNFIEGREFYLFNPQVPVSGSVAVDYSSNPPRLYVADTFNNRILGFADVRKVRAGDRADIVIGQPDFTQSTPNVYSVGTSDSISPTDRGLSLPTALAVDRNGNLWVADTGNARVLRFPSPFATPERRASVVIGQPDFTTTSTDLTASGMSRPTGVALTVEGDLVVADSAFHRVTTYRRQPDGTFVNGQPASNVLGQPNFNSSASVCNAQQAGPQNLCGPRQISIDSDDRLYLPDTGNNRLLIYNRITQATVNEAPALVLPNLGAPVSVAVSRLTGLIWVANTAGSVNDAVVRFPAYNQLVISGDTRPASRLSLASGPLSLTLDNADNLIIAEALNRVALYAPQTRVVNAASFAPASNDVAQNNRRSLAPGMWAAIFAVSQTWEGLTQAGAGGLPLPRELGDAEVLFNGDPAPLVFVTPGSDSQAGQVNFQVPYNAPTSGTASITIQQKSTGRVYATTQVDMAPAAPAFFEAGARDGRLTYVAAQNARGGNLTPNRESDPALLGETIVLYANGQGIISGAETGVGSPANQTPEKPVVVVGAAQIPPENITYSGLTPGLVGLWQINIQLPRNHPLPANLTPRNAVPVALTFRSIPSNQDGSGVRLDTRIWVRQP